MVLSVLLQLINILNGIINRKFFFKKKFILIYIISASRIQSIWAEIPIPDLNVPNQLMLYRFLKKLCQAGGSHSGWKLDLAWFCLGDMEDNPRIAIQYYLNGINLESNSLMRISKNSHVLQSLIKKCLECQGILYLFFIYFIDDRYYSSYIFTSTHTY